MYNKVFLILFIYFIIGAIFMFIIQQKNGRQVNNRDRWIKYFVYLGIILSIIISTKSNIFFSIFCLIIFSIGACELFTVWNKSKGHMYSRLLISLTLYLLIAMGFIRFALACSNKEHLFVYTIVLTFDGFSQIGGQLMGKNKLASKISPSKTVEGFIIGLITSVTTVLIIGRESGYTIIAAITWALLVAGASLSGDLLASYYKRLHVTKDYSSLIPGHGGVLDRFDSFIAAGSIYWLVSYLKDNMASFI
jgi:phosphatidate cytidylyltransferase